MYMGLLVKLKLPPLVQDNLETARARVEGSYLTTRF